MIPASVPAVIPAAVPDVYPEGPSSSGVTSPVSVWGSLGGGSTSGLFPWSDPDSAELEADESKATVFPSANPADGSVLQMTFDLSSIPAGSTVTGIGVSLLAGGDMPMSVVELRVGSGGGPAWSDSKCSLGDPHDIGGDCVAHDFGGVGDTWGLDAGELADLLTAAYVKFDVCDLATMNNFAMCDAIQLTIYFS
jgi:hypothetical protein